MSQELLFLLFMIFEGVFLIALYQFYLVPKVISPAVVEHWLAEIESGRINLPVVLESYTGELLGQVDALFFGYKPEDGSDYVRGRIQKFYEGAAGKAAQVMSGDPSTLGPQMLKELKGQPWYVQAIASKVLGPALERAGEASTEPAVATYSPGLARK